MEENKVQKKAFGCLSLILLSMVVFLIGAFLIGDDRPEAQWFKKYDLGSISIDKEEKTSFGKIEYIKGEGNVPYQLYLDQKGNIVKAILGKTYIIYDINKNDTSIDNTDLQMINNVKKFVSSPGHTKLFFKDSLKESLNNPTIKITNLMYFDMGDHYIINVNFQMKNNIGVLVTAYAKFNYNLKTGKYNLIEIM